ncbi:hypothetical protein BST97_04610 [Nonlabens spongiae]|uniref:Csm1 N-terminal domain-containing protein n=1 Tax=Nonlabens spongiae TaxID=331648 RepID=A0A1W6MIA1_9FLAO|nr:hypothetical protein [Nonlabens spongiae]ARN77320.1 hypothetical protein BST97_04610 [Nonlabens spongiae]
MATLTTQIASIRLKINNLIERNRKLAQAIEQKEEELKLVKEENELLLRRVKDGEERIVALKTANAMLGSDEYKTKTKLKINALVKEIDACIAQLT